MKKMVMLALLASTLVCHAQNYFEYQPLSVKNTDKVVALVKSLKATLSSDLGAVPKIKGKKYLIEAYEDRVKWLIKRIDDDHFIYDDRFENYIYTIFQTLLKSNPGLRRPPSRILLDRNPGVNAYCMGEGTIVVNLGLLSRVENEAQLAFVIAHEIAHNELDHVNKNIISRVDELYGNKSIENARTARQSDGSVTLKAIEILKDLTYSGVRHSRYYEMQADSLGVQLIKNSPYDVQEAVQMLRILDSSDKPKHEYSPEIDTVFSFKNFPFKRKWLIREQSAFGNVRSSVFIYDKDSLKTHPDVPARIEKIRQYDIVNNGIRFIQSEEELRKINIISDFESVESAFFLKDYVSSLYLALEGSYHYSGHSYYHTMIGKTLISLYEARKDHSFGKYVPNEAIGQNEDVDKIILFLNNLRLSEIGTLAFEFINNQRYFDLSNEEHYYLLWKICGHLEKEEIKNRVAIAYKESFPDGRFTTLINP